MSSLYDIHAGAIAATQAILGDACPKIIWKDLEWLCVPNSVNRRQDLKQGGFTLNADLVFEILVAQFGVEATELKDEMMQTPIGYLGDTYKVDQMNIRPGGLHIQVICNSISQNS